MINAQDAQNLNTVAIILLTSFALAMIIVGILLVKTNIFKGGKKDKKEGSKKGAVTFIGRIMITVGVIIAAVSLLMMLLNLSGGLS